MSTSKKNDGRMSVEDAANENFFDHDLKELENAFKGWQRADGQGNLKLWSVLGNVHELSAKVEANSAAKAKLVAKVNEIESVRSSNRWNAERRPSSELLITLYLGLKPETKATKSQWLAAVKAAKKVEVAPDREAFTSWIRDVGGVIAAANLGRSQRKRRHTDLKGWLTEIGGIEGDVPPIAIPQPIEGIPYPEGFAIILAKKADDGELFQPLASLADEKLLLRVASSLALKVRSIEGRAKAAAQAEQKERERKAKPNWKRYTKSGDYVGTLEEYVRDGCPEL